MARKLEVEIVGDSRSLERAFGRASKAGGGLGRSLRSLGKIAAVGVGAAFAGLAATLKVGFDELSEGQKVAAQTGAVLKSTGGIANVTAKHVDELAQAQSRLTGIDDELVQVGENLLLTFKNVRNEVGEGNAVFDRATKSALDLSTAGFGSVESTAKMMGKALNDPIKGMTALGRAGVTFSEDQKKAIKALVESGKTLEAQKLILKEVESQVGGSAKAYGETLPGQLSKLKNAFEEVAAGIASAFLPALTRGVEAVASFLSEFSEAKGFKAKLNVVWTHVREAAGEIQNALGRAFAAINWGAVWSAGGGIARGLGDAITKALAGEAKTPRTIDAFVAPEVDWEKIANNMISGLSAALKKSAELAKAIASSVMDAIRQVDWAEAGKVMGPGLAAAVVVGFSTLLDPMFWIRNWELALGIGAVAFAGPLGRLAGKLIAPLTRLGGDLVLAIVSGIERLSPAIGAVLLRTLLALPGLVGKLLHPLTALVSKFFDRLGGLAQFTVKVLGLAAVFSQLAKWAEQLARWIAGLADRVLEWAKGIGKGIIDGIRAGVSAAWDGLKAWLLGKAGDLVAALKDKLMFWSSPPEKWAHDKIGVAIIDGIVSGLNAKDFRPAIREKIDGAIEAARDAIESKRSFFSQAFDTLVSAALAAFDRLSSEIETRTERKLRLMDERAAAQGRRQAIADARRGLAEAQAAFALVQPQEGEDPQEFANRLGAATASIVAAQKALDDALAAQQHAALEAQAAKERKALENRRALQRRHLEEQLAAAASSYERGAISLTQYNERVLGILKRFGIPMKGAALALGGALAEGLREAFVDVQKAAQALAKEIITQLSKIRVIITVNLSVKDPPQQGGGGASAPSPRGPLPRIGGRQHGGPVTRGNPYIVGEAGPELFIPRRSGAVLPSGGGAGMAGGINVYLTVQGSVTSERDLVRSIRDALNAEQRRIGSPLWVGA